MSSVCLLFRCTVWTDQYIVTGCDDGHLMLFDFTLGEVVHTFKAHEGIICQSYCVPVFSLPVSVNLGPDSQTM